MPEAKLTNKIGRTGGMFNWYKQANDAVRGRDKIGSGMKSVAIGRQIGSYFKARK